MPEAPRPFRPRVPAPAVPAEAVREQLGRVRRRANLYAAQKTAYLAGAALLLGLSTLVGLAFLLSRTEFALAVWALLLGLGLLGGRLLATARRDWIPRREAARSIDRRAALEERLSTLDANPGSRSRLRGTLVRQNLALLPRWEPAVLVPRAVPRTVWVFLLAIVASFFILRWGGDAVAAREAAGRAARAEAGKGEPQAIGGAAFGGPEELSGDSELMALLTSLPDQIREAILGKAAGPGRGGEMLARLPEGAIPPGGEMRPGEGGAGEPIDPSSLPPSSGKGAGEGEKARTGEGTTRRPGDTTQGEAVRGDRPKELPRVESGKPREGEAGEDARAGQGGGRAAGAGSGGEAGSLYGPPETDRRAPERFELDLAGRGAEGADTKEGGDDDTGRPTARLAAEQRLDDAIRRAQVPPEYEGIVQRMFSRADPETTGAGTSLGAR